jgi:hypothetical protein
MLSPSQPRYRGKRSIQLSIDGRRWVRDIEVVNNNS